MNIRFLSFQGDYMYERMLSKDNMPSKDIMAHYCGEMNDFFSMLNDWLSNTFKTDQRIVFPYGSFYGWGISHKKRNRLICNVFPENNAFSVMLRLSNNQIEYIYEDLKPKTKNYVDNRYLCGDGGWIHIRIICKEDYDDILKLLFVKNAIKQ